MRTKALKLIVVSLCAVALIVSPVFILPRATSAAVEPKLNKSSRDILVGKTYNLNIDNKISGAKYVWTTSDKKIATVNNRGIVTAKKKGEAIITCTITTKAKKTYALECKVTVIEPASFVRISNKVSALNIGQAFDFDTIIPKTSNDKTTWSTSDSTIASPDKLGAGKALKEGSVTITVKTLSGKSDSVTFKVIDKEGIVTSQAELDELLESGVGTITIKTNDKVNFKIPRGNNERTSLVIDAPNAEVTNNSKFASVEIKQIAAETYYDNAGNNIKVSGKEVKIVVGVNSKVSIEAVAENTKITVENNGVIEEAILPKGSEITITGISKEPVPVVVNDVDCKITSSIPLNMTTKAKAVVKLFSSARGTKIQAESEDAVPEIIGNVTVEVTIGTGDEAETKPIAGQPIPEDATYSGGGAPGGGVPGGGGGPVVTPPGSLTFDFVLNDISSISITTVNNNTYVMDGLMLLLIKSIINSNDPASLWGTIVDESYVDNGKTISIKGTAGGLTKTVSISGGKFDGRSYNVTAASTGRSITVTSASNNYITIEKSSDGKSINIKTKSIEEALELPGTEAYMDSVKLLGIQYKGSSYSFDIPRLITIKSLISNAELKVAAWMLIVNETITIDGQNIKITGTEGNATKNVTFLDGQFQGQSYTVTINTNEIIVVDSNNIIMTFIRSTNNIRLSLKN